VPDQEKILTPEEQSKIKQEKLEKRYNIDKWKIKKVITNPKNREVIAQMRRDYQLEKSNFMAENLYRGLGNVIQLEMSQSNALKTMFQNIEVELNKLRKATKKVDVEND